MSNKKAKLKYKPNTFEILEEGDHVVCAVSKKIITLDKLSYWNTELQEAYYSAVEANIKFKQVNKK